MTLRVAITDPYVLYQHAVRSGALRRDEGQLRAAKELQKLYHRVLSYTPPEERAVRLRLAVRQLRVQQARALGPMARLGRLFASKNPPSLLVAATCDKDLKLVAAPQGLLLTGDVGCGKSMLMDMFAEALPVLAKARWHCSGFLQWLFREVETVRAERREIGTEEVAVFEVAQRLLSRTTVLMLDELALPDVATAAVARIALTFYLQLGGVLVATSNRLPRELAAHGIGRERSASFAAVLQSRCFTVELSGQDYRAQLAKESNAHLRLMVGHRKEWLVMVEAAVEMRGLKEKVAASDGKIIAVPGASPKELTVYGRKVVLPLALPGAVVVDFEEMCRGQHSAADFMSLAAAFPTVVVDRVPPMTLQMKNEARRFISLVDALYDARCQLYLRTLVPLEELFFADAEAAEFSAQAAETYAHTAIDMESPYRPNAAMYNQKKMAHYEETAGADYTRAAKLTGEDERFAYLRALLRIREMVALEQWRTHEWAPAGPEMRPWEREWAT